MGMMRRYSRLLFTRTIRASKSKSLANSKPLRLTHSGSIEAGTLESAIPLDEAIGPGPSSTDPTFAYLTSMCLLALHELRIHRRLAATFTSLAIDRQPRGAFAQRIRATFDALTGEAKSTVTQSIR